MHLEQLIRGDDSVQQHVASERQKQGLVAVSSMARRAIKQEILPQIEESVISADSAEELCQETKRAIEAAFSYKNDIYTRLIQYKSIDQSDTQFLEDLLLCMDEWLRQTKATIESKSSQKSPESGKQEVEVTVKLDSDGVKPEENPEPETQEVKLKNVTLRNTEDGPKLEPDPNELFDLGNVRW